MAANASDELLQKVRDGELDTRRVLLTPDATPGAGDLSIEALLEAEPSLGEISSQTWAVLDADPGARIADVEPDRRFWIADLLSFWASGPGEVSQITSPQDGMYAATPDHYFPTGALALRCVRLAMFEARKTTAESILDFACGYGRVMRHLRAAFPDARLTACDITADAVEFCAQEFDAVPVYSDPDPARVELPGPFDLIWVGSLFTHVPKARWIELLDLLAGVLAEGGLLVLTTQGRHVRHQLLSGQLNWDLTDQAVDQIVADFDHQGFGYADWSGMAGYGTSLNAPSWVAAQIEQRPGLRLMGYRERGWGRQDVVSCEGTGK